MAGQADAETLADRRDRLLEALVGKRLDFPALLIDDVVMVALGVGDLIPCDAVAPVETMQQPELEELVEYPVDRCRRAHALETQLLGDFLCAQQALALSGQQLDDRRARCSGAQARATQPLLGSLEPTVTQPAIHARSVP
jgi:hypothetical protein